MKKSELKALRQKHVLTDLDMEDAIEFVNDLLYFKRKELERDEPYAINTIQKLEDAEHEVWDLLEYVEEIMLEEE